MRAPTAAHTRRNTPTHCCSMQSASFLLVRIMTVCPAHLQLHWDTWTAHRVFLPCWEPVSLLHELHELHEERVRNPKAPTEAFERSGAGLHEAFLLQLEPPTRLPPVFALINTPPKNFVYKSGRGRAPAALLTLEPASHGLFVVCVRCGVFQIKTFSAPDFRHGPVPKTCCRKFQTENVLFPAAQETEKFSKPKKGKKKFVNPAAQETALSQGICAVSPGTYTTSICDSTIEFRGGSRSPWVLSTGTPPEMMMGCIFGGLYTV